MSYHYTTLPDPGSYVRLFTIERADANSADDAKIWCHMQDFRIANLPQYNGLSYEWGDDLPANRTSNLLIKYAAVRIPVHLHRLLLKLCSSSKHSASTYFFADAICINQSDEGEKSAQIPLMGEIFSKADTVQCWLGEVDKRLSALVQILACPVPASQEVAGPILANAFTEWVHTMLGSENTNTALTSHNPEHLAVRFYAIRLLAEFVKLSYWMRVWIVQEIVLARQIVLHYGGYDFEWSQLEHWLPSSEVGGNKNCILDSFGAFVDDDHVPFSRYQPPWENESRELRYGRVGILMEWRTTGTPPPLSNAIFAFGFSNCKYPRDRVYGMLGLAQRHKSISQFPVDTERSSLKIFFDTLTYCKDDYPQLPLKFVKHLWAMLELRPYVISDEDPGSLPVPTLTELQGWRTHTFPRIAVEMEEETMLSKPRLERFPSRSMYVFSIRPSNDLSGLGTAALLNMTLASASRVTGFSTCSLNRKDTLLRFRGTPFGLIYSRGSSWHKGQYVVAETSDRHAAIELAAGNYLDCFHSERFPDLQDDGIGGRRANIDISDPWSVLVLASDIDGTAFKRGRAPFGQGLS